MTIGTNSTPQLSVRYRMTTTNTIKNGCSIVLNVAILYICFVKIVILPFFVESFFVENPFKKKPLHGRQLKVTAPKPRGCGRGKMRGGRRYLTMQEKIDIIRFSDANPQMPKCKVALAFSCTSNTVRTALKQRKDILKFDKLGSINLDPLTL